ncbi:MAG: sigma-54-dependent Fis family transcriptional regulator [Candidatus Brocadia sp. AMX2]|nr:MULTISPECIES: sigma-54 dependent transcriptional regulator [Brocadia]MBC6933698.1 sigma-54-dependent Fis family transcriptional regulator [Candidatus Brocadia sp.]MBL1170489.1 sigma-54-dependent Fis family transcriptional regulator [Candidatus Brocadia sp. AMX1]MCK6469836.1 sigma-54 dependent transcriptional regulator [Candidatus Brocadia sinica]NOG40046.1 sigma-54-dependent Fis family transcriptional regulator [Planctomycetota bacterium]KAA0243091.1 MAG: sigma-54-dependent Fis family trans
MAYRVLIADDEERMRRVLAMVFEEMDDVKVITASNSSTTLDYLDKERFHLLITDLKVQEMGRLEFLRAIKNKAPDLPIIVLTAYGSVVSAIDAMKEGVFDYLTTPFEKDILKLAVKRALKISSLTIENKYLRQELESQYNFGNIIGNAPQVLEALRLVGEVSKTDSTVLISGESGTGKELIARAIHYNSDRACGPLIALNCAAIPENLLESELFGYEKGAFTSAEKTKKGRFELAVGGTFFMDEISEMSLAVQAKVLRVIEAKELERLGGTETVKVDLRIICATNKNLEDLVKSGKFREDLYYRISVFPITLTPLRERREDIIPLSKHFLKRFSTKMGKAPISLSKEVERLFMMHKWEGNIRELQNVIERAVILCKGNAITSEHLPISIMKGTPFIEKDRLDTSEKSVSFDIPPHGLSLDALEKQLVTQALEKSKNNKTKAAKLLGLTRGTFRYRLQKYGLTN